MPTFPPTTSLVQSEPTALAFELRDVQLRYSVNGAPVIDGVSANFRVGEFVSIVGPSGCGKSTLLKMLAGLLVPTSGSISRSSAMNSERIGFVFQHPTLLPWRTAVENLELPLELGSRNTRQRLTSSECVELLRQVGLKEADGTKRPSELSGGMQMRLSLARALATQPTVMLLDEPFAAVDDLLRMKLQDDVRRIHDERRLTTILVTHNLHEAVYLSDRVIVMSSAPSSIIGEIEVAVSADVRRASEFRESAEFQSAVQRLSRLLFAPHRSRSDESPLPAEAKT